MHNINKFRAQWKELKYTLTNTYTDTHMRKHTGNAISWVGKEFKEFVLLKVFDIEYKIG